MPLVRHAAFPGTSVLPSKPLPPCSDALSCQYGSGWLLRVREHAVASRRPSPRQHSSRTAAAKLPHHLCQAVAPGKAGQRLLSSSH
jgi:hypothetical protein